MKLNKFKWFKFKQLFRWGKKFHSTKSKLPISVQDIQDANSKYFASSNDVIKIISLETQTHSRFPISHRDPPDSRKTLSYQTSSIYLSDVLKHNADTYFTDLYSNDIYSNNILKPSTNIYQTKENSRYLLQTINKLLQETEHIYNEICPSIEIDQFDNLSIQLEPTIWEDTPIDILSNFIPALFDYPFDTNDTNDTAYDYLDEFLELYVKAKQEVTHNDSNLQTYKGFSGSTLVLNT